MISSLVMTVGGRLIIESGAVSVDSPAGQPPTTTLVKMMSTTVSSTSHPTAASPILETQPSGGTIWDEAKSQIENFVRAGFAYGEPVILIGVAVLICSVCCLLKSRVFVVILLILFNAVYIKIKDLENLENHPGLVFG
jgi:hypothetical protein